MFCPRCGQQPNSNAMRFCANCGLRLEGVTQLLANDGFLPNQAAPDLRSTQRKKGLRTGAKFLFSGLISLPLIFAFCFWADSPVPLLIPATLLLTGICWMIYARFLSEENSPAIKDSASSLKNFTPAYLPRDTSHQPANFVARPVNTKEIESRFSVTEPPTQQFKTE